MCHHFEIRSKTKGKLTKTEKQEDETANRKVGGKKQLEIDATSIAR